MSLQGVLSDFGAADIFQLIAQQRKTGVLEIEGKDGTLVVSFQAGQVVRARPSESHPDDALASLLLRTGGISETDLAEARRVQKETLDPLAHAVVEQGFVSKDEMQEIARLLSNESIFGVFLLDNGRFSFSPDSVSEEIGDLVVGAEMVLLDALRMRDEWPQVQKGLHDLAMILAQNVDVEVYQRKRTEIERETGISGDGLDRLFNRCDGRLTARRVIDLSRLGTFEGARGLVAMLNDEVLKISRKLARPRLSAPALAARGHWTRMPWVLAAAGLAAAGLWLVPAPAPRSHPLPRAALLEAHAGAALEQLRAGLEAHRWRTGKYPESLEVLSRGSGDFLAGIDLDRYSYVRRARGYTLLAN